MIDLVYITKTSLENGTWNLVVPSSEYIC